MEDRCKKIAIAFAIYVEEMCYQIDCDDADYYMYVDSRGEEEKVLMDDLYDRFLIKYNGKQI